ncbi:MAG TPA: 50S ribosomal protein L2 [Candidatus Nanoarchaeia archaeon]|nr:50S ribosomal protein L2 [Candidatus Nanoarchaeia archaeon]
MGKDLIQQRRGRGSFTYRSNSFRFKGEVKHLPNDKVSEGLKGVILDIFDCSGHTAPLAKIKFDNGEEGLMFAFDKMRVNDTVVVGGNQVNNGNTLLLKNIPEGTLIYNVESVPGDGGSFCRAAGTFARVTSILQDKVIVQLPSKKSREFHPECRATVGVIAGSGRLDKPWLKAGKVHHEMRAKGKLYPRTAGVAMNAVDHPFGSGRGRHPGKPKTAPRFAPAGRKVGKIRARKTGRGK